MVQCFRCDQEAVQECPRCGAFYCDAHGDALCERCADPVLAVPSYRVFRGSLLALLVGSVVAVWLLVLPPAGADQDGPPASLAGIVQSVTPTPATSSSATPTAAATETATATPTGTSTATATTTPQATTAPASLTYTVQPGDTLIGIAQQFGVDQGVLARANNITDPATIQVGQVLTIPQ